MKIISLVWHKIFPAHFGGQKAVVCFQEHLARHFDVSCLCPQSNEPPVNGFLHVEPLFPGGKSQFINPLVWLRVLTTLKKNRPDILLLEHPYHGLLAIVAKKLFNLRLVLHQHNIEFDRFRQLKKWWWPLLRIMEKAACRSSDLVLFMTPADQARGMEAFGLSPEQCLVVPYGVDFHPKSSGSKKDIFQRHRIPAQCKLVLFAGTLDYEPNAQAVRNIYEHLAPGLDPEQFRIIVCGRIRFRPYKHLMLLKSPVVIMAGEVSDISEYYHAADVFLNPVLLGGGVQTKTLDALSFHLNVVCFESTENLELRQICPEKMFLAPRTDWSGIAEQIPPASTRTVATPDAFFNAYNWDKIVQNFANVLNCRFNHECSS